MPAPKKSITPEEAIHSAFDKFLTQEFNKTGAEQSTGIVDIITFCETWLKISFKHHPMFKILLKMYYFQSLGNTSLEITDEDIDVIKKIDNYTVKPGVIEEFPNGNEWLLEKAIRMRDGRITKPFQFLVAALGRRSGKTFMASAIIAYEVYKLLEMVVCHKCDCIKSVKDGEACPDCGEICENHPQVYYHVPDLEALRILMCATTKAQAIDPGFNFVKERIMKCPYFDDRIQLGRNQMNFLTKADMRRNARLKKNGQQEIQGSVIVRPISSNMSGGHGTGAVLVYFDEFGLFPRAGHNDSDAAALEALSPQTLQYRHRGDGRIVMTSMPMEEDGEFYAYMEISKDRSNKNFNNVLSLQMPTWEYNRRFSREDCEALSLTESKKEGISFDRLYGSQFSKDSEATFIPAEIVDRCFDIRCANKRSQTPTAPMASHYMQIDCATTTANYAYVVIHTEFVVNKETGKRDTVYVEDDSQFWCPDPERYGYFVNGDTGKSCSNKDILSTIVRIANAFRVCYVGHDSMQSLESRVFFKQNNINTRLVSFGSNREGMMYDVLRDAIMDNRVVLCSDDWQLRAELKALKSKYTARGLRVFSSITSDVSDCLAAACQISGATQAKSFPKSMVAHLGNFDQYHGGGGASPSSAIRPGNIGRR